MRFNKGALFVYLSTLTYATIVFALFVTAASAQPSTYRSQIQNLLTTNIHAWLQDPIVINSIKAQNAKHTALTQDDIDRLDKQWRAERKSTVRPLIDSALTN